MDVVEMKGDDGKKWIKEKKEEMSAYLVKVQCAPVFILYRVLPV
jgi:hypothetical protein